MPENTPSSSNPEKPFRLDDPRQRVIHERLHLLGESPAAFYFDACRHMATDPPFEATTNIVGHLLREIESALRDVLLCINDKVSELQKQPHLLGQLRRNIGTACRELLFGADGKTSGQQKREIKMALDAIEIPAEAEIARVWRRLGDRLYKFVHRNNLQPVRPVDNEFREIWDGTQEILRIVLDRLETKYEKVFDAVDKLAQKEDPVGTDANVLSKNIPNNPVVHGRFFNQLKNPKWLPMLRSRGFFKHPPNPIRTEEGTHYVAWPELNYLQEVATIRPTDVSAILSEMPPTENINVQSKLLLIASKLPREQRLSHVDRAKQWMKTSHRFFGSREAVALIRSFSDDGRPDVAINLSKSYLEIIPDPAAREAPRNELGGSLSHPVSRIDPWEYSEFLTKEFPRIAEQNPGAAMDALSDVLESYYKLHFANAEEANGNDLSHIGRPMIEQAPYPPEEVDDTLITAILRVAEAEIKKNPAKLKATVGRLEKRPWNIFQRMTLYLLSKNVDQEPQMVADRLTNKKLFSDSGFVHEYALLAGQGFGMLGEGNQETILGWIEEGPGGDAQARKAYWQRDKLSFIKEHLPSEWRVKYEELVSAHGEPDHANVAAYFRSFTGPTSDVNADAMEKMSDEKLLVFLRDWEPKPDTFGFGPTKEGLGRELDVAIKKNPQRFILLAGKFQGQDPTYVRAYLQAFHELAQNNRVPEPDWDALIQLCGWVMKQSRAVPGRKGGIMNQDPDWGWTRRAVASLVSRGLNVNLIPYALRDRVWEIIEPLTSDPYPSHAEELDKKGTLINDDAYGFCINTARGEGMHAAVEYALWVYRNIGKEKDGEEKLKKGFDVMPEVRTVLESHIDPAVDDSVAVRSIYGRYLPWLLLMDRRWTLDHLGIMLPEGKFHDPYYLAIWETYVMYVPAYNEPFKVLMPQYMEAVQNLGTVDAGRKAHYENRDEKLAEQLMVFYWRDLLALDGELMKTFWKKADAGIRTHALDFVGRSIKANEAPLEADQVKLLVQLWEARITAAENAVNADDYKDEMAAFGWWFASEKLDPDWSLDQLIRALAISGKTEADYLVVARLAALPADKMPKVLDALEKMILGDGRNWFVLEHEKELKDIFRAALAGSGDYVKIATKDLIGRLLAKGYDQYADLS